LNIAQASFWPQEPVYLRFKKRPVGLEMLWIRII
jgi:hypothetical protein